MKDNDGLINPKKDDRKKEGFVNPEKDRSIQKKKDSDKTIRKKGKS